MSAVLPTLSNGVWAGLKLTAGVVNSHVSPHFGACRDQVVAISVGGGIVGGGDMVASLLSAFPAISRDAIEITPTSFARSAALGSSVIQSPAVLLY